MALMNIAIKNKVITASMVANPALSTSVDLTTINIDSLPSREQALLYALEDVAETSGQGTMEMTLDEFQALLSLAPLEDIVDSSSDNTIVETAKIADARASRKAARSGVDYAEVRINTLQNLAKDAKDGYVLLIYDIPAKLTQKNECPNPSVDFWCHGFRLNESCWVMPRNNSGVQHPTVKDYMDHWNGYKEVHYHIIRFHDEANEQIRKLAEFSLREELLKVHHSLIKTIGNADERLQKALIDPHTDINKAEDYRMVTIRARIKVACNALDYAIKCAELYDMYENVHDALEGLRNAILAQKEAYDIEAALKDVVEAAMPASV